MPDEPNANAPLNPDLMGYPTVEALVAAKRAGDAEAKRLHDENQQQKNLLSQLINSTAANQRADVPNRHARPSDRLTEFGVPVDALGEFIGEKVGEALQPLTAGLQARQTIVTRYPDYVPFEADVWANLNANPDDLATYNRMFSADPVGAWEYAFLKFGESRRRTVGAQPQAQPQGMTDASIPTGRSGDARRGGQGSDSAAQEAFERFQRTGSSRDARTFAEARLAPLLEQQFNRTGQSLGPDR